MKHVFTSAGILALSATVLNAYDPEMTRQLTGRPWTVAATVRGFYDDNVATSPNRLEHDSFGIEVSPSAHLNLPLEQTFISLGYIYSLKWYEDREPRNYDQSHEFNGKLRHQFGPKNDIGVDDSFVITSEPTIADRFGIISTPTRLRTRSNITHNRGAIEFNTWFSQQIGLSLGYVNNWYDYEQENTPGVIGSRSALLDRIEHLFRADLRYQVNPSLVALVGYMFGINDYTGDDVIAIQPLTGRPLKSDFRDNYTHRVYVGADYDITAKLRASARVGGEFTDFHESGENSANPYADVSLTYVYMPGSTVDVGVRHTRNATDVSAVNPRNGRPTLDAETTVLYGQITHKITHNLTGSLIGQYQSSTFNDGLNDDNGEDLFLVGINFEYRFNRHLSAEAGYNYDNLDSDIHGRSYDRNRVYVGLRATY